jgi:hypothetical protein
MFYFFAITILSENTNYEISGSHSDEYEDNLSSGVLHNTSQDSHLKK